MVDGYPLRMSKYAEKGRAAFPPFSCFFFCILLKKLERVRMLRCFRTMGFESYIGWTTMRLGNMLLVAVFTYECCCLFLKKSMIFLTKILTCR